MNNSKENIVRHMDEFTPILEPVLKKEKCGVINEFLWTCAGVNKQVLRQCPGDYAKYAGIGGTILFTALMAAFSGGYALNFVFNDTYVAVAFGVFWGLLIFNLDRFIVNTMYSDGKHTISWAELKSGLPRIIMAIFLGIVISTPLELKIFDKEIQIQMEDDKQLALDEYTKKDKIILDTLRTQRESKANSPVDPYIMGSLLGKNAAARQKIEELEDANKRISTLKNREISLTGRISAFYRANTHGDSIKALNLVDERRNVRENINQITSIRNKLDSELRTLSAEYNNLMENAEAQRKSEIEDIDKRIAALEEKIKNAEDAYKDKLDKNFGGLRAQMKAFSELREENPTTNTAAWFIMLLFIIIETAPTFFKMMMEDGPYDDLLNAEKHRVRVLSQKRVSDVNDEVNTSVKISTMKNQKRLEAEILANEDILKKIAMVQAELLQKSIDAWREEELQKIAKNPSAYITTSSMSENDNNPQ